MPDESTAADRRRFVVLRHELRHAVHWDLMLEHGETLATWRLPRPPSRCSAAAIPAERIGQHRRAYLDYEGPVSGDRGVVTRHDAGTFSLTGESPDAWDLHFAGRELVGRYRLSLKGSSSGEWILEPVA